MRPGYFLTSVRRLSALALLELAVDGIEAEVDGFFEGVGGLGGHGVVVVGHYDFDEGLLVHGRFGFHYLEGCVYGAYIGKAAGETLGFFVDERGEGFGDVEVDCLNADVHVILLFFVHEDVRVRNCFVYLYRSDGYRPV